MRHVLWSGSSTDTAGAPAFEPRLQEYGQRASQPLYLYILFDFARRHMPGLALGVHSVDVESEVEVVFLGHAACEGPLVSGMLEVASLLFRGISCSVAKDCAV